MASEPAKSGLHRFVDSFKESGPGWLLSAYTLGSGSAAGSLWAGAQYGYDLLWVQPVSMLMGVIMMSCAAYVTLRNEERPYKLFAGVSPALAVAWGAGSLFASIIWHFPQYGLAYDSVKGLFGFGESFIAQLLVGAGILSLSIWLVWSYARGGAGLKLYELAMKLLVWMTCLCLLIVVAVADVDWGAVFRGLFGFRLAYTPDGAVDTTQIFGLLSAAVGINMTFLYPYSLKSKGWSRDALRTAGGDLIRGMMLPYMIATGLLVIATAATVHGKVEGLDKGTIVQMSQIFDHLGRVGPTLYFIGILAMPLSSITLHMLTCGFIVSEMMDRPMYGREWKLGSLLPAVGALGVFFQLKGWLPVAASALTLLFLPIAYYGFLTLFHRQLKADRGSAGAAAPSWLLPAAVVVTVIIAALAAVKAVDSVRALIGMFGG